MWCHNLMVVFARPTLVRIRLSDHQQIRRWPDPAGRYPILTIIGVSISCLFHISSLMLLGDEFSGCAVLKHEAFGRLQSVRSRYILCIWRFVSAICRDLFTRLATVRITDKQRVSRIINGKWYANIFTFLCPLNIK